MRFDGYSIRVSHFVNHRRPGWVPAAKQRDQALRRQVLTNPHSPEMYRANGPIRNIPDFFAAFGVKEGDKMYLPPGRQVKIW